MTVHSCRLNLWLSVVLLGVVANVAGGQVPSTSGLVHLLSGDSVELVQVAPFRLATGITGLGVQYHPFIEVQDSPELTQLATRLWRWLQPQLDSANPPPFVVLMATTGRANPPPGFRRLHNFNHVVERRPDGKWYFANDSVAVR